MMQQRPYGYQTQGTERIENDGFILTQKASDFTVETTPIILHRFPKGNGFLLAALSLLKKGHAMRQPKALHLPSYDYLENVERA